MSVAVDLIERGSYTDAMAILRGGLKTWGEDPVYGWQFQGLMGLVLLRVGEAAGAIPYLEDAVRGNELDPALHRNLASALLQTGRRGRALTEYQVTVELLPTDPIARLEYGQLLTDFRAHGEAQQQLLTAARLCGECIDAQLALAKLYLQMRRPELAVEPLRMIWDADPGPASRRNLVAAMSAAGQDSLLVQLLVTIPAADRTLEEWRLLVESEAVLGECKVALDVVQDLAGPDRLPEIVTDDAAFWAKVALILLDQEYYEEGLMAADRSVLLDPDQPVYRNNRAVLLTRLGRDEEAREELEVMRRVESSQPANGDRP